MEKRVQCMIRVTPEIRAQLKKQAADNERSMIDELYHLLFGVVRTHTAHTNGRLKDLRHASMEEKVNVVIQKMKESGYVGKGGFYKASKRGLGHHPQTADKYWNYYLENKDMFDLPKSEPAKPFTQADADRIKEQMAAEAREREKRRETLG